MQTRAATIALLTPRDHAAARQLLIAGLTERWGRYDAGLTPDIDNFPSSFGDATTVVATTSGQVIGTSTLVVRSPRQGEIVRMSVAREYRRSGIGGRILERLLAVAQQRRLDSVALETTSSRESAVRFYAKHGLRKTHEAGDGTFFAWTANDRRAMAGTLSRHCRPAVAEDFAAIGRMLELYQYELSDIWEQELGPSGEYGYDLTRHREAERFLAHVALVNDRFAGFALVAPAAVTQQDGFWMEQFFILKRCRRTGLGHALARHTLLSHPGAWEVGQMHANHPGQLFWRKVIASLTGASFTEVTVTEGGWQGVVQRFSVAPAS